MENSPLKILAVDDNEDNLTSVKALIREAFPQAIILTATEAGNGIELAQAENPDVILLDVVMPGMDGFEACRQLKANPLTQSIPVVFLTAIKGDKEARIRALEVGAEAFLSKPIDEVELTAQIRAMQKIKAASTRERAEKDDLTELVAARTRELELAHTATLNLLEDLRKENTARRKSEEEYRFLFENLPSGVVVHAADTAVRFANPEALRLLGLTLEQMQGKTATDPAWCFLREDGESLPLEDYPVNRVRSSGETFTGQIIGIRLPGRAEPYWVSCSAYPQLDASGQISQVIVAFTDITARVQAEEARRAEKRAGALIENAPDGIVFVTTDGKFTYGSPTTHKLFGYDTDEMSQLDPNVLTYPDDLPRVLTVLSGVIQNPSLVTTLQYRFRHKDGRWLWIESTFSNLIAEPSIQAIVINFRDITERKQAEDALRESEERFRAIANYAVSWESWFGPEGKYIWVNPAVEHFTGYSAQEILALPDFVSTVIADEDRAMFIGRFQEAIRGSREDNFEFRYLHKDGTKRWLSASWQPIYDAQGNPLGTRSSGYDITARKQAEDALRKSEARFRQMFEKHDAVMLLIEPQTGLIMDANQAAANFYGYEISQLRALSINDINTLPPEQVAEERRKALQEERNHFVFTHRLANGTERIVEVHSSPIPVHEKLVLFSVIHDITARKQAEEDLQRKQAMLEQTEALAHVGSWEWEVATDTVIWSDELFRIFRRDPDPRAPSFAEHSSLYLPEDFRRLNEAVEAALREGTPYEIELHALCMDGGTRTCLAYGQAEKKDGRVVRLSGSLQDITDRKQAEESLRESEAKYRLLAENATDVIWVLDVESETFRYMSPSVKRLRGYTAEEVMQQDLAAALTPASLEYLRSVVPGRLARFRQGQIEFFRDEIEQTHQDGHTIWTEVNARYFVNRATGRVEVTGATRDITERKRAEAYRAMGVEVLQILNEPGDLSGTIQRVIAMVKTRTGFDAVGLRLQDKEGFPYYAQDGFSTEFLLTENTLIECGKDGGVCRDEDGHVCLGGTCGLVIAGKTDPANPLFTRGGSFWTNDSFPLLDLPADQDPRRHPRNQCIHDGYASVALVPIRTKDRIVGLLQLNDRRKGRFTLETVELLEGIASHIGAALMRKQAEEEQIKLQSQLVQAQKMESVGRLAGGVAHDFNNMLAVILGYTEVAMDQVNTAQPLFAALREIRKAAQRSADLTRQLLAFARKQTIAPRVLDLNETVDGMLKMLRRLIGEDIDLVWKPGRNLGPVKVDPSQIDQLLANLCVNARDAIAGVGKVTIETDAAAFDEAWCAAHTGAVPGEYVLLAVSDNGCGMDQETLDHLFEPFFTTKEVGKGTGLGLASIYGMVQQNKGFVNVSSEPGQGTTFKVYLPRHSAKTAPLSEKALGRSAERGDETILLVEDEPAILKMATMMLKGLGYTVVGAKTPGEAVRLAEAHVGGIHLLVTDVVMPEMNGRDLAKHLLALHPNLKCLFMSGYTADVIAHQGVLAAGVQFIQKPFSLTDLAAKLRQALGDEHRKE